MVASVWPFDARGHALDLGTDGRWCTEECDDIVRPQCDLHIRSASREERKDLAKRDPPMTPSDLDNCPVALSNAPQLHVDLSHGFVAT